MEEEFDGGIPNTRVMIKDVTIPQALQYKEELKKVDGVQELCRISINSDGSCTG